MIKIVKGNDVKLRFPFFEKLEEGYLKPLDMAEVTDLAVTFITPRGEEIEAMDEVSIDGNNVVVLVPAETELGRYHVAISGLLGNANVRSVLRDCFSIVQFNSEANFTDTQVSGDSVIDSSVLLRVEVQPRQTDEEPTAEEPTTDEQGNENNEETNNENTESNGQDNNQE